MLRAGKKKEIMANDELYTPKWVFHALNMEFDLDVCAPHDGSWHTPTKAHICACCGDGLTDPWHGVVFMNPPYSAPTSWVYKWINHNNGIALVPMSKSQWFNTLWQSPAVGVPLTPRMKFDSPAGKPQPIFMPTMLWAIGLTPIAKLEMSGIGKVR